MRILGLKPMSTWDRAVNIMKILENNSYKQSVLTDNNFAKIADENVGRLLNKQG